MFQRRLSRRQIQYRYLFLGRGQQASCPRPTRRKDNPYEILSVGIGTVFPHYYLFFIDRGGTRRCIEIDKPLFDAFDRFELEDISYLNEVDRHYEQSDVTEETLNRRAIKHRESVEETVLQRIEMDKLYRAIAQLPEKQRRCHQQGKYQSPTAHALLSRRCKRPDPALYRFTGADQDRG